MQEIAKSRLKAEAPGSENRERKYSGYDWYWHLIVQAWPVSWPGFWRLLFNMPLGHRQMLDGLVNCSRWVFSVFPGWPVTIVHQTVTNSIAILEVHQWYGDMEVCYITLQCWIPMFRDFSRVTYGSLFSQTRVSNLEFLFTLLVFPKGIPNFKAQWMQIKYPRSYQYHHYIPLLIYIFFPCELPYSDLFSQYL